MKTLQTIETPLLELIKTTGNFIRDEKGKIKEQQIDDKAHNSFVTYVDKKAESMLVEGLQKLIPGSGFIAEEGTAGENESDWRWIIDPLDGTTNYIHDIYPVAVSVALQHKEQTVAGVVYEVGHDELFYAFEGAQAMLNGKPIQTSSHKKMADSLYATGFPYYDYERLPNYMKVLDYMMQNTRGIRRHGSAATDLVYVACGRFDAFFEYSLSPWDVAAGAFIVEKAGGIVTDFKGGNNYLFGEEIIATNSFLAKATQSLVDEKMN